MKTVFINGTVVNVFTGELEKKNVIIEDGIIAGVGDYGAEDADEVTDASGMYICPGFIDSHIHIESTMLLPVEFTRVALPHGTTAVIADPHEIANVCGKTGIEFMLAASEGLPLTFYIMLPSCVPATEFDENGATLLAEDLSGFYSHPRVLGLGEVMDYNGVVTRSKEVVDKINDVLSRGYIACGHAPLLTGKELDKYISAGITDDHECSSFAEAADRIRKGQHVMIRQGTVARNLSQLLPLFDEPFAHRCLLASDDKHPADLLKNGHIDEIIRDASAAGKDPITGIRMATLWAAEYFGIKKTGAVAAGYKADLLLLDDLDKVSVYATYVNGIKVAERGVTLTFAKPEIDSNVEYEVRNSFRVPKLRPEDFSVPATGRHNCRVIKLIPDQVLTDEVIDSIDFDVSGGIRVRDDILKIAVVERYNRTGNIGLGFVSGVGLPEGAIASSVAHDSHNIIVVGTNDADMAFAANRICEIGGGNVTVKNGEVISEMPLPYAGLMSGESAQTAAALNEAIRRSVHGMGVPESFEPFMTMAFVSLSVIPHLKITSKGLINVDEWKLVPLICD